MVLCTTLLVVASACATGSAASSDGSPKTMSPSSDSTGPQGFTKITLIVTGPDGAVAVHCVWLADTVASRDLGLMNVTDPDLGGPGAMVFQFDSETSVPFWMKDTLLPLSIAWIDGAGSVVATADMEPCPAGTSDCPRSSAGRPYRLAIEMAQGRLQDWGLVAGSTVRLGSAC
jgi:uncharacterized membrane protein (UPF0127 family)